MRHISDADYRLLAEKLPQVLRAVRYSPARLDTINAARRLSLVAEKFQRRLRKERHGRQGNKGA